MAPVHEDLAERLGPVRDLLPEGTDLFRAGEPDQLGRLAAPQRVASALSALAAHPDWCPSEPSLEVLLGLPRTFERPALELRFASTPAVEVAARGAFPRVDVWRTLKAALAPAAIQAWEAALMHADLPVVQRVSVEIDLRTDAPAIATRLAAEVTPSTVRNTLGELDALAENLRCGRGSREWLTSVLGGVIREPTTLGVELVLTPSALRHQLVIVLPDLPIEAVEAVAGSLGGRWDGAVAFAREHLLRDGRVPATVLRIAEQGAPSLSVDSLA